MIRRILIPLDGSSVAECVLPHAAAIASVLRAETILLNVVVPAPGRICPADVDCRLRRAEALCCLEEKAQALRAKKLRVEVVVLEGRPAEQIRDFARSENIDLIVLSTQGEGGSAAHLGAVAQEVISGGATSLLLIRARCAPVPDSGDFYRRIMVPVDGSPLADWALCLAASIARGRGAELLVVHAVEVPDMPRRLPATENESDARSRWVRANRRAARRHLDETRRKLEGERLRVRTRLVVTDHVARTLHKVADEEEADLIVASAHGASGASEWEYGSVAMNLITHGRKSLLVFQDAPWPPRSARTGLPGTMELNRAAQLAHNGAGG